MSEPTSRLRYVDTECLQYIDLLQASRQGPPLDDAIGLDYLVSCLGSITAMLLVFWWLTNT